MKPYDSRIDTKKHIERVRELLMDLIQEIDERSENHDLSKLGDIERPIFDEYTPKLKSSTYGSDEYKQFLKEMEVALDHHYKVNKHHPEHHNNGIYDMDLVDLIEMLVDQQAASERHANGSILKSIEINTERFGISDQLVKILLNTLKYFEGKTREQGKDGAA